MSHTFASNALNSRTNSFRNLSVPHDHWCHSTQEALISFAEQDLHLISLKGGAENGEFCYVSKAYNDDEGITYYNDNKLLAGDILLKIGHQCISGFTLYDLQHLLMVMTKDCNIIRVIYISQGIITKDLKEFLNTRFHKGSMDHELQQIIRVNIYKRTVPITTRGMRKGEVNGVDYEFVSKEDFQAYQARGDLLESGIYDGNFYGTPKPPALKDPDLDFNNLDPLNHKNNNYSSNNNNQNIRANQMDNSVVNVNVNYDDDDDDEVEIAYRNKLSKRKRNLSYIESGYTFDDADDDAVNNHNNEDDNKINNHSIPTFENLSLSKMINNASKRNNIRGEEEENDECGDDDDSLPPGWQKVNDYPDCGVFYIDHINKKTQYERPRKTLNGAQVLQTELTKGQQGLGFTIIGGDQVGEPLQIKHITPFGPAHSNGDLHPGDILLEVNDQPVSTNTHQSIISLFQNIPIGSRVKLKVKRGQPLSFDLLNPANKVITTQAVKPPMANDEEDHRYDMVVHKERVDLDLIRGSDGFRFTICDHPMGGQKVRSVVDQSRCRGLQIGDVIEQVNSIMVLKMSHTQVVDILKACPIGRPTHFLLIRYSSGQSSLSYNDEQFYSLPKNNNDDMVDSAGKDEGEFNRGAVKWPLMSPLTSAEVHPIEHKEYMNNMDFRLSNQKMFQGKSDPFPNYFLNKQQVISRQQPFSSRSKTPGPMLGRDSMSQQIPLHLQHKLPKKPRPLSRPIIKSSSGTPDFVPISFYNMNNHRADVDNRLNRNNSKSASDIKTYDKLENKKIDYKNFEQESKHRSGFNLVNNEDAINYNCDNRYLAPNMPVAMKPIDKYRSKTPNFQHPLPRPFQHDFPPQQLLQSEYSSQEALKTVTLLRKPNETFGFVIASSNYGSAISSIQANTPASIRTPGSSYLQVGDKIEYVNKINVEDMGHNQIVTLIRNSGLKVSLTVAPGTFTTSSFNIAADRLDRSSNDMGNTFENNRYNNGLNSRSSNESNHYYSTFPSDTVNFGHHFYGQVNQKNHQISNMNNNFNNNNNNYNNNNNLNNNNIAMETYHHVEVEKGLNGFGFTVSGGNEFENVPLCVLKVTPGGAADLTNNLKVGDELLEINGLSTINLSHSQAVDLIQTSSSLTPPRVLLYVKRPFKLEHNFMPTSHLGSMQKTT